MKIKFSDIATFNAGQSPESKYYSTDSENDFPFLQGNRTFGTFFPTFDTYTSKVTKKANRGDILMSVRAPVGDLNFAPCDLCIGRGLSAISAKDGDNDFLFYALKYNIQTLIQKSTGTTFDSVNKDIINNLDMIIPNQYSDRKKASKLLRSIDNKIDNNTNVNRQLEYLAKTLYDYWFLQFEFPNEEGKPYKSSGGKMVWNEELKIEIPEGWKSCILGDFYKSQTGYAFKSTEWKNTGHPVLTIKAIEDNGNVNMDEASFISKRYNDSLNKYSAKNGNLIFAMSGNTIGKIGLIASNIQNVLINQRVLIIDTSTENVAYPYFTLNCLEIQNKIRQLGANSAQPNISESQLNNIKVVKPDSHILNIYNEKCAPMFKQIISNRIQNQQLSSLRDWLLPMLMNGQVTFEDKDNN